MPMVSEVVLVDNNEAAYKLAAALTAAVHAFCSLIHVSMSALNVLGDVVWGVTDMTGIGI